MIYNFLDCSERIERIHFLIKREITGTPKQLAEKINLSERHTYRLVNLMRDLGAPIIYCPYKQTYKYTKPVKLNLGFTVL